MHSGIAQCVCAEEISTMDGHGMISNTFERNANTWTVDTPRYVQTRSQSGYSNYTDDGHWQGIPQDDDDQDSSKTEPYEHVLIAMIPIIRLDISKIQAELFYVCDFAQTLWC